MDITASTGLAFFLMCFDAWIINLVKRLLSRAHGKHMGLNFDNTGNIPGEVWIACAVLVPVAVCLAFGWDLIASITGTALTMTVPGWMARTASGVLVGMGAQKTYDVAKAISHAAAKNGIAAPTVWTSGGPTETPVPPASSPPQPPTT